MYRGLVKLKKRRAYFEDRLEKLSGDKLYSCYSTPKPDKRWNRSSMKRRLYRTMKFEKENHPVGSSPLSRGDHAIKLFLW